MKKQDAILAILPIVETVLPSGVPVRTSGGSEQVTPPVCIVSWDSSRLPREAGHTVLGEILRDSNGKATGYELHRYSQMELDILVRSYSESDRDSWLDDLADEFLVYEFEPDRFHEDTTEWVVGEPLHRSNQVVDTDWYEGSIEVRFKILTRVIRSGDILEAVVDGPNGGVYDL